MVSLFTHTGDSQRVRIAPVDYHRGGWHRRLRGHGGARRRHCSADGARRASGSPRHRPVRAVPQLLVATARWRRGPRSRREQFDGQTATRQRGAGRDSRPVHLLHEGQQGRAKRGTSRCLNASRPRTVRSSGRDELRQPGPSFWQHTHPWKLCRFAAVLLIRRFLFLLELLCYY